jgi:hypothetical protein
MRAGLAVVLTAGLFSIAVADDDAPAKTGIAFAEGLTFEQALAAAAEEKKPVFVYFTLDG